MLRNSGEIKNFQDNFFVHQKTTTYSINGIFTINVIAWATEGQMQVCLNE